MNPSGSGRPGGGPALGGGGAEAGAATTTIGAEVGATAAPGMLGVATAGGGGAASPAIQLTIAARRGSPTGSGAPPACICPEALVRRRLDSGACTSTSARTIASSLVTSPDSRNRVIPAGPPVRWQAAQTPITIGCTALAKVGPAATV